MSEQEDELTIRRILVALDASHHSLAALRAAVELASRLEAEVRGLFVEDVNLLRVAALPMARELQFPFNATARLNPARMERQLRAQAEQARQALASVCRKEQITWSFHVARGDVVSEVLEAAAEADLLSLGTASRPVLRRRRTGSTARAVATQTTRSVLLIPRDADLCRPVVVPHDGSPAVRRALTLAARLAEHLGGYLSVLVLADTTTASERLQSQIGDWTSGQELVVRYRELPGTGVRTLIDGVRTEGTGTLVLSRAILPADEIGMLLDEAECPVLLVR